LEKLRRLDGFEQAGADPDLSRMGDVEAAVLRAEQDEASLTQSWTVGNLRGQRGAIRVLQSFVEQDQQEMLAPPGSANEGLHSRSGVANAFGSHAPATQPFVEHQAIRRVVVNDE